MNNQENIGFFALMFSFYISLSYYEPLSGHADKAIKSKFSPDCEVQVSYIATAKEYKVALCYFKIKPFSMRRISNKQKLILDIFVKKSDNTFNKLCKGVYIA